MLVPVLLGTSIIVFLLIHLAEGDPARIIAGRDVTAKELSDIRQKHGLDKPLYVQYFVWIKKVVHGDLGRSLISNESVTKEILARFPNTVELSIFALILAILVGMTAGIVSASRQYSCLDYTVMGFALIGVSMPVFWLGIMLMMIFGIFFQWLPIGGRISIMISHQNITGFYIIDNIITGNIPALISSLQHLILPAFCLATISMATIARVTRSSMLEILRQDFIRTERAKGLSEGIVIYKHAVKNALIPVVTVIGLNFGKLLAGAILTETVFSWPGLGRYIINSVNVRDYPAVQGCVLFFALLFVIVNLVTDIIYVYIDPRIRYS